MKKLASQPSKADKVRMGRSPGSGSSGSGNAMPPANGPIGPRASRMPGKGKSGSGDAMPKAQGPGMTPRGGVSMKTKHGKMSDY